MKEGRQAGRQEGRQAGREAGRQAGRQAGGQAGRQTGGRAAECSNVGFANIFFGVKNMFLITSRLNITYFPMRK